MPQLQYTLNNINNMIVITSGDPASISPFILLKAFNNLYSKYNLNIVTVHNADYLQSLIKQLKLNISINTLHKDSFSHSNLKQNMLNSIDIPLPAKPILGKPNIENNSFILSSIDISYKIAKYYNVPLVTNPVSKFVLSNTIKNFNGHTNYLAKLDHSTSVQPVFISREPKMIVGLISNHLPLSQAIKTINTDIIINRYIMMHNFIKTTYANNNPKIAILGLNPHSGEDGLLGTEERDIIMPAISYLKDKKYNVRLMPLVPDSAFIEYNYKQYDALLCLYHDQGLIGFKSINFNSGVQLTNGLSIIRTSPCHGTSFDIAEKYTASSSSLEQSIIIAHEIYQASCYE